MAKFSFSRVVSSSTEDCAARLSKKGPYIISSRVCTAYINVCICTMVLYECSGRVWREPDEADPVTQILNLI